MMTNVDLPKVLSFESEDHVLDFIEAATEIIPKIKYKHIGGEGYNCVVYTRKDKNYRAIIIAAEAPVTIIETPVLPGVTVADVQTAEFAHGSVVNLTYTHKDKDGKKVMKWTGPDGTPRYYTMPTDSLPNAE